MASTDDLAFARAAVQAGLLDQDQADECCDLVKSSCDRGVPRVLPETLVKLCVLTPDQVQWILAATGLKIIMCAKCSSRFYVRAGQEEYAECPHCGMTDGEKVTVNIGEERAAALIGRTLGDYEILEHAGSGGMSDVYRARNRKLDRVVALKLFTRELVRAGTRQLRRFMREGRSAAKLNHPNVIAMYHVGEIDGRPFIEMEFIYGGNLGLKLAKEHKLEVEAGISLFRKVAEALECAHAAGIVHRDIKPENILLTEDGEPRVTDFGLAKTEDESVAVTGIGKAVGTSYYVPPEMIGGYHADVRSDLYSLGVTMYEALTGVRPFTGKTQMDVVIAHKKLMPKSPSEINPDIPQGLSRIILKLLNKNPDERFQSAHELIHALDTYARLEPLLLARLGEAGVYTLVPLMAEPVSMGRARNTTLPLNDLKVSRRHAEITRHEDIVTVRDLGSRNGTWVNETRIESRVLVSEDLLRAGRSLFVYLGDGDNPTPKPPAAIVGTFASAAVGDAPLLLRRGAMLIGRDVHASVRLDRPGICDLHAHLCTTAEGVVLTDLTSGKGVTVNGKRIKSRVLKDGDQVNVGDAVFTFRSAAPRAESVIPVVATVAAAVPAATAVASGDEHNQTRTEEESVHEALNWQPEDEAVPTDNGAEGAAASTGVLDDIIGQEAERIDQAFGQSGIFEADRAAPLAARPRQAPGVVACTVGALQGQSWTLGDEPLVAGRDSQCDVVIDDPKVSRKHTSFTRRAGVVFVKDLGSLNGTWVNGVRAQEQSVAPGDIVKIGPCQFVLHL